jgi:phenylalanyl-tRNA synthetase alpha chain
MNFKDKLAQFKSDYLNDKSIKEHSQLKKIYVIKDGLLDKLTSEFKLLSAEDKKNYGSELQSLKIMIHDDLSKSLDYQVSETRIDVTSYKSLKDIGHLHPYTHITRLLEDIFISMGYAINDGPEIETDYINFEALNIPADHPARDMQDTFWLNIPKYLMRTQTSTVQVHALKNEPPMAIFAPGRAYRCEATDASHDVVFMQAEGMVVGSDINLGDMVGTLKDLFKRLLGNDQIRIRPSYFPFVEPGLEVDARCPFCKDGCATCKYSCWIEICGAGMIHPNVLREANLDYKKYTGFAFGMGLTRLAMILYSIPDIRLLHSDKLEFLNQFR